jgi:hypothetical protein
VQGLSSTVPLDGESPESASNRRIVIVVLTLEAEEEFLLRAKKAAAMVDQALVEEAEAPSEATATASGDAPSSEAPSAIP